MIATWSPAISQGGAFSYFNDFSNDIVGQPPGGWDQFGTTSVTPFVVDVAGNKKVRFPSLGSGQTDKYLINRNFYCESNLTATAKIRFLENADSAGLVIGWKDQNSYIKVQLNP